MRFFKKADEMELHIAFLSMRLSWVFTSVALLIWSFYDVYKYGKLNLAFDIATVSGIIYWSASIYFKNKMR